MRYLASVCTSILINRGIIKAEEREIYEYGFDITIYTVLSTCGLMLIGLVFKQVWNTVILVSVFYTCQSSGGGYHASTHLKCFVGMCIGLCSALVILSLSISMIYYCITGVAAILLIMGMPLELHANRAYLSKHTKMLTKKSIRVTCLSVIVTIGLVWLGKQPIGPFALGYFLAALSRASARILSAIRK